MLASVAESLSCLILKAEKRVNIAPATGNKYPDILGSHLQAMRIDIADYFLGDGLIAETRDRKKSYKLLLDHATLKTLLQLGSIDAMVSFQRRTNGNFAVARLFDTNRIASKKDI